MVRSSSQPNFGSALLATELGTQFLQQTWKFRVSDQMTNPAGLAKTLLHEMDLIVRELSQSSAAKYPESGGLIRSWRLWCRIRPVRTSECNVCGLPLTRRKN